ncbi:hypothetical protein [Stenotrophomonas sp. SORGH_AS_0282]|uniref:hypothetical protein n=1 Tax=Stenotrophomonas sp. SORGH_AS_0282 TaxID=3041763 RepID=UPI0027D87AF9|nr:hypothetical protein [Stenotrophomonas sp. SORGH_AS_0282]
MFSIISASSSLSRPVMSTFSMVPRACAVEAMASDRNNSGRKYFKGGMGTG